MTCEEIQNLMLELDAQAATSADVRKHLIVCADCRAAFRDYEDVLASLREMPALEPSVGFTERIVARVSEQRAFRRQLTLAIAAVVAIAGGAWFFATTLENWLDLALATATTQTVSWLTWDWGKFSATNFVGIQFLGLPVWQIGAVLCALALGWLVTEALDYLPRKTRR